MKIAMMKKKSWFIKFITKATRKIFDLINLKIKNKIKESD